ncbi:hypothetical protein TTHERM_000713539 (macronuclear) [Tetrahymena thermophila SB210]|uniref:Uncharacterized protein n=1 Tax=Tetrahymena thermophila (strain SB210) TaxID=312017 RepID=W7WXF9_TETTS|nr:hypothetical protein TTHERM_000713539 [Tetrahymena thermophila SB210]EWS71485.1 hypothetical protein TTHERM_000713539 [Tetrahymena thermophila SB210]|eukprot:XP_012655988.1 hypothetical protein TTHERM_000713539 [Tetrahymena thermophila SB210]
MLNQNNNQEKQLQIREANIDQNTDEYISNSCVPKKFLQSFMLKSKFKKMNQNSNNKKPREVFK